MKTPTLLAALCLLSLPLSAEESPAKNVQIDAEFIEVSEALLTDLLHSSGAPKSGAEWRTQIGKWIKEAKAKVIGSTGVTTKSGNRATSESSREVPYATEFDPANGRASNSPEVPREITGVDVPTPTAFEVKPVGARMEIDPVVGADNKTIDLNIAPELTYQVGEVVHQEVQNGEKTLATIKQPEFYTVKVITSISVRDGSSTLAGIMTPQNEKGDADITRRVLCLISARLMAVE
ncbi:MAG: hypothetical protein JNJ83_21070 [Verrucomicrobiaceae bacterium]|nr:hypothetical protein [Verrucomicrobiaceae bacterium]